MLLEAAKENFQTLARAFEAGDVALMECTDNETGELVPVICAMQKSGDAEQPIEFVPFAMMIAGDPYERLTPPTKIDDEEE